MTKIDQFESVFKAADKTPFVYERVSINNIMLVTDLDPAHAEPYRSYVDDFLSVLNVGDPSPQWNVVTGDLYTSVAELVDLVVRQSPDLVVTYRNLHAPATEFPHSLGAYVDVLTQATDIPVMLMPHPARQSAQTGDICETMSVMAITDHLAGDNRLVQYAVRLTEKNGRIFLTHVEDKKQFERFIEAVSKVPSIDTDEAREQILQKLLGAPRDYIVSCRQVIEELGLPVEISEVVSLGCRLQDCKRLIAEHDINLLVLNTKDDDQLAMHGVAYPLSVELRDTPMLLL